jgi:hypothetical protein
LERGLGRIPTEYLLLQKGSVEVKIPSHVNGQNNRIQPDDLLDHLRPVRPGTVEGGNHHIRPKIEVAGIILLNVSGTSSSGVIWRSDARIRLSSTIRTF